MATFLSLPAELLIEILSFITVSYPHLTMEEWMGYSIWRTIRLSIVSRVHPSLTDLARSLMVQEIQVERFGDPIQDTQLDRLSSPPWKTYTIKHLALRAVASEWKGETFLLRSPEDVSLFSQVVTVHCQGGSLDLRLLSLIKSMYLLALASNSQSA
jgi:hypothetical protein